MNLKLCEAAINILKEALGRKSECRTNKPFPFPLLWMGDLEGRLLLVV